MADIDSFTTYVQNKLTDVISAAEGAAGDLENIAEGYVDFFTFNPLPEYSAETQMVNYTPANVTLGAVTPYAAPTKPTLEFSELGTPGTLSPFVKPSITGFNPEEFDPSEVDGEIAALAAKILAFIDSGGPGISDEVQTALMTNMRARDLQTLDDVLLRVRQENSMSGWPRSNSIMEAAEAEHRKKYQDTYDNRSSEILALMTERAHQTAMNGLNAGVQTTQIKSNLQAEVWKLYYAMQGLILDKFKTDVAGEVSRVEADLKKILGDYDLLKTRALTESGIKLDMFKVESQGEETRVRTDAMLETAKADVGLKSNEHLLSAAIGETKSQLEKWLGTVDHLTKRGVANIQQLVSENEVRYRAAATEAEYYKGLVVSLGNMVSTLQISEQ